MRTVTSGTSTSNKKWGGSKLQLQYTDHVINIRSKFVHFNNSTQLSCKITDFNNFSIIGNGQTVIQYFEVVKHLPTNHHDPYILTRILILYIIII